MENIKTEKIESLNLIALRKYACPRVSGQNDWYLKCVDCKGLEGCPVGKRVLQIIEDQTTPEKTQIQKFEERLAKAMEAAKNDPRSKKFIEAFRTDDPSGYLVKNGYFDKRWRANDAIKKWQISHGVIGVQTTRKESLVKAWSALRSQARERVLEVVKDAHSIQDLLKKLSEIYPDQKASSCMSKLYDWVKKHPDISADHPEIREAARFMSHRAKLNPACTVMDSYRLYMEDNGLEEKVMNSEEVSISDFLNENPPEAPAVKVLSCAIHDTDILPEPILKAEAPAEKPAAEAATDTQKILQIEFGKKRIDIKKRIADLEAEIQRRREQLEALDKAAALFGMLPTN